MSLRQLGWLFLLSFLSHVISFLLVPLINTIFEGLCSQSSFQMLLQTMFSGIISLASQAALPYLILPFFSFLLGSINGRREETLMAVSQGLPTEGEKEISGEVIPSEGKGDCLAC